MSGEDVPGIKDVWCTSCLVYKVPVVKLRKPAGRLGVVSPCERSEN